MRTAVIIWLSLLVILVAGFAYMNHSINQMVKEVPEDSTLIVK